jgi:hypothetical protein
VLTDTSLVDTDNGEEEDINDEEEEDVDDE